VRAEGRLIKLLKENVMDGTKSRQLKIALCGLASLGMLAATQGCSSSNNSGAGGSTGSGGSTTATGGHGTGGTTGGTGGAGVDAGPACTAVPADGKYTDFTADGGAASGLALSNIYTVADTAGGLTAPTFSTSTGSLVVNFATGMPTSMYPYAGIGVPLAACANASAFTGVQFNISGTLNTGCTIQFSAIDKEHITIANMGICAAANCYPSSKGFTLPSTAMDVKIAFADQANGGMDTGAAPLDPTKITGVQWQVNPTGAMGGDAGVGCTGSITIDNVMFYH
jgi:hypothetical protein